jgi:hypothetical protein
MGLRTRKPDPFFREHTPTVLTVARQRYALEQQGEDPDLFEGTQVILTVAANPEAGEQGMRINNARLTVAARVITEMALLRDIVERGGPRALLARLELFATEQVERSYFGGHDELVLGAGGLIEQVRGNGSN